MTALWIGWAAACAGLVAVGVAVGMLSTGHPAGVLVDQRGRYSLNRLQLVVWMFVVLSLLIGVTAARLVARSTAPLEFTVPPELLGVLGLSVGTTVVAGAVKANKSSRRSAYVAATPAGSRPRWRDVLLVEEGPDAERTVDITKLQNLLLTAFLSVAYAGLAVHTFLGMGQTAIASPSDITALPSMSPTFLTLLAVSQAGYVGGKLPDRGADPVVDRPAHTVEERRRGAVKVPEARQPTASRRAGQPSGAAVIGRS
jgi:hypothetical protein